MTTRVTLVGVNPQPTPETLHAKTLQEAQHKNGWISNFGISGIPVPGETTISYVKIENHPMANWNNHL